VTVNGDDDISRDCEWVLVSGVAVFLPAFSGCDSKRDKDDNKNVAMFNPKALERIISSSPDEQERTRPGGVMVSTCQRS
jgi:hypothetical protein